MCLFQSFMQTYAEETAEHNLPCQMNDVNSKAVIAHILCPFQFMPLRRSLAQRLTATRQTTHERFRLKASDPVKARVIP